MIKAWIKTAVIMEGETWVEETWEEGAFETPEVLKVFAVVTLISPWGVIDG